MEQSAGQMIEMRLTAIRYAAHDINLYSFAALDGARLPPAEPGAHVDLHLANGMVRPYSLAEIDPTGASFTVGVKRDGAGRGGSVFLHDHVRVGQTLRIGGPRNHFPLAEAAAHSVLIAGGIGITPIRCMALRLRERGRDFTLHYACREARDAAFGAEIAALPQAHLHVDARESGRILDVAGIVARAPDGAELYCCGPAPMLAAFEAATAGRDPATVHIERFAPAAAPVKQGGFVVVLRESGREFAIPEGRSILDVLREAGLQLDFSCEQGICGACKVGVLEGEPDHRDMVLSEAERAAGDQMMICCSGSRSGRLVLAI